MTAKRNYTPLDADELVDPDYLGTGAGGGKYLKDDQTWDAPAGGSGAPTTADYLVGTAQGGLSAEIVVGASPGGELGGTWASPTVDATHSGSAHHTESHASRHAAAGADAVKLDDLAAPDDNTDLNASTSAHGLMQKYPGGSSNYLREDGTWAAPSGSGAPASVDYLVGTADGGLSAEIVVGTTPGGELGGTWASPTVDATHSGSAHHTQSHDHSAAGDGTTLTPAHLNTPQETPGTTEGRIGWDTTEHQLLGYDTQRGRSLNAVGWLPRALPMNYSSSAAYATASAVPANGGSVAVPIWLPAHMLLQDASVRNTDTSGARTWGWDLYVQRLNNGNSGENTLDRVAASSADESFTAAAASNRVITAGSAPVYLAPGMYWFVFQNRHATQTFGLATTAVGSGFGPNLIQTKTTTNPNGATLDFVAATWSKGSTLYAVVLRGRVFGETASF